MKILKASLFGLCSLAVLAGPRAEAVRAATLAISCGAVGQELTLCRIPQPNGRVLKPENDLPSVRADIGAARHT